MVPRTLLLAAAALMILGSPALVAAQPVLGGVEDIDLDRPEAWAMKRSASLTLLTALGPPVDREAGTVQVALELGWNPGLSEDEMRVGFNGTKVEDLNRLAVIPRPRVLVGIGRGFSLDLAWVPPVDVQGIEPNLLSAALERPIVRSGRWVLGVRAYGQIGTVKGDITCPEQEAAIPPGDSGNVFGCEEPSADEVTLDYAGIGLTGGYWITEPGGSAVHFGAFANYMDLEFQVHALTFGLRDRTLLRTDGWTYSLVGGLSLPLGTPTRLGFEAFYSPLRVDRPVFDAGDGGLRVDSRNDGLLNLRAMISYRF